MIAAASPRFIESDTPESTVSGPRGVGYCLLTSVISSMGGRDRGIPVHFDGAPRHLCDAVMLAYPRSAAPAQFRKPLTVFPERANGLRQAARIVGLDQDSAAG